MLVVYRFEKGYGRNIPWVVKSCARSQGTFQLRSGSGCSYTWLVKKLIYPHKYHSYEILEAVMTPFAYHPLSNPSSVQCFKLLNQPTAN